jgi:ribonucleotide reductase beta subunit family protein with ferritin-like domain
MCRLHRCCLHRLPEMSITAKLEQNKSCYLIKPIHGDDRLTTFPIARPAVFKWYEDATKCFWTTSEITTGTDALHYETKLSSDERRFVKYILAFFAASDGIVNLNLAERFKKDINILEVSYFYDFQITMENIHAQTYSMLLNSIIPSQSECKNLLNAIETMPIIKKMSQYMFETIRSTARFAERLLRMACVEGILFTGCFCAIYWLQSDGRMPGFGHSNELIARDEALHTMFAMFLYTMLDEKLPQEHVYQIICEAVNLAKEFIIEALPNGLPGMSAQLMIPYIECQADNLVTLIDLPVLYGSKHSFHFMEQINLANRTNFFERRVSEYAKVQCSDGDGEYPVSMDF